MESLAHAMEELLGRASGPMHLRLLIQPVVSIVLGVLAGLKDGREGQPPFLWGVLTRPDDRGRLLRSAWKNIAKLFVMACLLDVVYQLIALHTVRPIQTLIVAVVLAVVPYTLIRGPISRLARGGRQAP